MRKLYLSMIFAASAVVSSVRAELLIVKKEGDAFEPLSEQDVAQHGKRLQDILLKYQWPMVVASDLTQAEQDELLSAGVSYAEEKFIEKRVQEISPDYGVVFIPTTLYELFCVWQILKTKGQKNPLQDAASKFFVAEMNSDVTPNPWKIEFTKLLNQQESPVAIRQQINDVYKKANALFGDDNESESVYVYISNHLVSTLFEQYPELKTSDDSFSLSSAIKSKTDSFALFLIRALQESYPLDVSRPYHVNILSMSANDFKKSLKYKKSETLITSIIDLDYEARELNKALLLRGTSFEKFQVGIGPEPKQKELAGTTLKKVMSEGVVIPLEVFYGKKMIWPYSISFGNSLLAGILLDPKASAYRFLTGQRLYPGSDQTSRADGYVLLIDKKSYFQHQVNNLFFIPSLTTLTSLIQKGEYFHSRTKAATISKKDQSQTVSGLLVEKITDPTGVILITRDPLRHAELFSNFLADPNNVRIIQDWQVRRYNPEEQSFVKDVFTSQTEAAKFYKSTRIAFPIMLQYIKKWKEKKGILPEVLTPDEQAIADAGTVGWRDLTFEDFRTAKKNMNSSYLFLKLGALDALTTFVMAGYAFSTATEAAKQAMSDSRRDIKEGALDLFVALVNKGQALEKAAEVASQAIMDENTFVRWKGLKLFRLLVGEGQFLKEAAEAAKIGYANLSIIREALNLFKDLFKKKYELAFTKAIDAAKEAIKNLDAQVRAFALLLFESLVNKGYALPEAAEALKQVADDQDSEVQQKASYLREALQEQGT